MRACSGFSLLAKQRIERQRRFDARGAARASSFLRTLRTPACQDDPLRCRANLVNRLIANTFASAAVLSGLDGGTALRRLHMSRQLQIAISQRRQRHQDRFPDFLSPRMASRIAFCSSVWGIFHLQI
ncbi:MAG: hypothetical protein U0787_14220 [Polyangia bacterium]